MSANEVVFQFGDFTVRQWAAEDRENVADLVRVCLEQYGLQFEPSGADRDAVEVEDCYLREGMGEFWVVVNRSGKLVGSGGYYKIGASEKAVEIRKMYLLPEARGKKLGRALLEVWPRHGSNNSLQKGTIVLKIPPIMLFPTSQALYILCSAHSANYAWVDTQTQH